MFNYKTSSHFSLSIIYGVFAVSNWVAPSVIALCGPKWSMVIGGVCYVSVLSKAVVVWKFLNQLNFGLQLNCSQLLELCTEMPYIFLN